MSGKRWEWQWSTEDFGWFLLEVISPKRYIRHGPFSDENAYLAARLFNAPDPPARAAKDRDEETRPG